MNDDRHHRIRQRAHAIWESQGRPHGSDLAHWDQATREIEAEDAKAKRPARAAAAPKPRTAKAPAAKKPAKPKAKPTR